MLHRVYSLHGETWEGGAADKCPGEASCEDWNQPFEGSYEAKVDAVCRGCPKFESKPMAMGGETALDDDEVQFAVDRIEDMIDWEDAGFATDWEEYELETKQLFVFWRAAEAAIKEDRARRFDALVKGFLK